MSTAKSKDCFNFLNLISLGSEQTRRDTVPRNMNRRRSVARKEISVQWKCNKPEGDYVTKQAVGIHI